MFKDTSFNMTWWTEVNKGVETLEQKLKVVLHSRKSIQFIFSTENPSKNMTFRKTARQNRV